MDAYVCVCVCVEGEERRGAKRKGAKERRRLRAASTVLKECFLRTCTTFPLLFL